MPHIRLDQTWGFVANTGLCGPNNVPPNGSPAKKHVRQRGFPQHRAALHSRCGSGEPRAHRSPRRPRRRGGGQHRTNRMVIARKPLIVPIAGTTKLHRLGETIGAAAIELTADDLRDIDSAVITARRLLKQSQAARRGQPVHELRQINAIGWPERCPLRRPTVGSSTSRAVPRPGAAPTPPQAVIRNPQGSSQSQPSGGNEPGNFPPSKSD
jgi:hypothetical protein